MKRNSNSQYIITTFPPDNRVKIPNTYAKSHQEYNYSAAEKKEEKQ